MTIYRAHRCFTVTMSLSIPAVLPITSTEGQKCSDSAKKPGFVGVETPSVICSGDVDARARDIAEAIKMPVAKRTQALPQKERHCSVNKWKLWLARKRLRKPGWAIHCNGRPLGIKNKRLKFERLVPIPVATDLLFVNCSLNV